MIVISFCLLIENKFQINSTFILFVILKLFYFILWKKVLIYILNYIWFMSEWMFYLKCDEIIDCCLFVNYCLKFKKDFYFYLKKKKYLKLILIVFDFYWIDLSFWFKLEVELRIIWKNWKLKNFKKFKILKLNEDSGSKLICI